MGASWADDGRNRASQFGEWGVRRFQGDKGTA